MVTTIKKILRAMMMTTERKIKLMKAEVIATMMNMEMKMEKRIKALNPRDRSHEILSNRMKT